MFTSETLATFCKWGKLFPNALICTSDVQAIVPDSIAEQTIIYFKGGNKITVEGKPEVIVDIFWKWLESDKEKTAP